MPEANTNKAGFCFTDRRPDFVTVELLSRVVNKS